MSIMLVMRDSLRGVEPRPVLTRGEAASLACLGLSALDERLRDGTFKFFKCGRRVLIPREAFLRALRGDGAE